MFIKALFIISLNWKTTKIFINVEEINCDMEKLYSCKHKHIKATCSSMDKSYQQVLV